MQSTVLLLISFTSRVQQQFPHSQFAQTMTREGSVTLITGENQLHAAVISPSGDYAYFGTNTPPGRIVKVALRNFTRVGSLTLNTGEDYVRSAVISPSGDHAYFGTDTSPGI